MCTSVATNWNYAWFLSVKRENKSETETPFFAAPSLTASISNLKKGRYLLPRRPVLATMLKNRYTKLC